MNSKTEELYKVFDILEEIEMTSGTNEKIEILSKYSDNDFLKLVFNVSTNPYFKTQLSDANVNHILEKLKSNDELTTSTKFIEVLSLNYSDKDLFKICTDYLNDRVVTGNEMLEFVTSFIFYFNAVDNRSIEWLPRILTKKLRIGISESNLEKALKINFRKVVVETAIDTYKLNENCNDLNENIDNYIIEEKFDGIRLITVIPEDEEIFYATRNGRIKTKDEFPKITAYIELQPDLKGMILDGELTGTNWNEAASMIHKKMKIKDQNLKLNVFDILPIDEFFNQKCSLSLEERKYILSTSFKPKQNILEMVPYDNAISIDNIWARFKDVVKRGGEGIMIKNITAPYEYKRSKNWLKLKQIMTDDFLCVGIEEGTGKRQGRLGAIVLKVQEDPEVLCKCSGFTDEQSRYFWNNPNEIIDHIVEVEYRTKTTNKNKSNSLRHPVFLRVRNDK